MRTKVERRKMQRMNQFMIQYIYIWNCHDEALCIAILNKKCLFFLSKNGEQEGSFWGLVPEGGERI
jgi:hypothetical protein